MKRPNILLIIVHDIGAHLGCYGQPTVPSPHLDSLAAEGVRFANHFCTAAFCSPSRGAIFTGKYPHTNGLLGLVNLGWDLPETNTLLSQALHAGGYETYLFGLQHEVPDEQGRLQTIFDHVGQRGRGYPCHKVAAQVVEFLSQRPQATGHPFYVRVGFSEVHRPFHGYEPMDPAEVDVPPYLEPTPGAHQDFAAFHGAIRTTDEAVGRILQALEDAGLAEETIVVFTTDHGIAFPRAKGTVYDPGMRTALLIRWPKVLPAGHVVPHLISNVDLMPSLLEAVETPAPAGVQGRSFLPLLMNNSGAYEPRDAVYGGMNTIPGDLRRCIRTKRHKYIRNLHEGPRLTIPTDVETEATRRDMGDAHLEPRPAVELYDLATDPLEFENLAGKPEMAAIEMDLAARLEAFRRETSDPALQGPLQRPAREADILRSLWSSLPGDTKNPMRDIDTYLATVDARRR